MCSRPPGSARRLKENSNYFDPARGGRQTRGDRYQLSIPSSQTSVPRPQRPAGRYKTFHAYNRQVSTVVGRNCHFPFSRRLQLPDSPKLSHRNFERGIGQPRHSRTCLQYRTSMIDQARPRCTTAGGYLVPCISFHCITS
jgi:hypothetical protein